MQGLTEMPRLAGPMTKVVLIFAVLVGVFPKIALIYIACGLYDVLRNTERTPELFEKYFLGEGLPFWLPSPVWLMSPLNALLDLLSLPYLNKGVFTLDDLPREHQDEIVRLIRSTRSHELIEQLRAAASAEKRSMFFFKYYRTNVGQAGNFSEFHEEYKWIVTIGVSVFNRRQSVSKHFGPVGRVRWNRARCEDRVWACARARTGFYDLRASPIRPPPEGYPSNRPRRDVARGG